MTDSTAVRQWFVYTLDRADESIASWGIFHADTPEVAVEIFAATYSCRSGAVTVYELGGGPFQFVVEAAIRVRQA